MRDIAEGGPHVTLYHAVDCSLCARAIEVVRSVRGELDFDLALVDIAGSSELEARYRELVPAVEIDGELVFTYFVDEGALRKRLRPVPPAAPTEA